MCVFCNTWKTRNDVAQDSSRFVRFVWTKNDWTLSSENLLNVYKIPTPWRTSCAITAHPTLRLVKKTAILPNLPVPASRQPTTRARPLTANSFCFNVARHTTELCSNYTQLHFRMLRCSYKLPSTLFRLLEAPVRHPWSIREASWSLVMLPWSLHEASVKFPWSPFTNKNVCSLQHVENTKWRCTRFVKIRTIC